MHRTLRSLIFLSLLTSTISVAECRAQIRKPCGDSIYLKLSATSALQGSLVQVEIEISSTKTLPPELAADWDGKPSPVWREEAPSKTLHGMIGVDLEKPPARYEYKISWKDSAGQAKSCTAALLVRAGKFPTEHLKVEKQFVQPDPEQQKRAEEDSKKMRAIYDTITPQPLWKGPFRMPLSACRRGFPCSHRYFGLRTPGGQSRPRRRSLLFREHHRHRPRLRNLHPVRPSISVRRARRRYRRSRYGNRQDRSNRPRYWPASSLGAYHRSCARQRPANCEPRALGIGIRAHP
jgi:hypothetical protein